MHSAWGSSQKVLLASEAGDVVLPAPAICVRGLINDKDLPITGGCRCGAVRYPVSAAVVAVRQCWRRDCQYWASGSATVNAVFEADKVAMTGALPMFVSAADPGNTMRRGFRPTCGTPIARASDARPQYVILRVAAMERPSPIPPAMTIWTGSAPDRAHHDPAIPTTPKGAPPLPPGAR